MKTKDDYHDKLEEQLKEWSARIDILKGEAEKKKAETKLEFRQQIEQLREKKRALREKVNQLKKASGKAWVYHRAGVEKTAAEFKTFLEHIILKFI